MTSIYTSQPPAVCECVCDCKSCSSDALRSPSLSAERSAFFSVDPPPAVWHRCSRLCLRAPPLLLKSRDTPLRTADTPHLHSTVASPSSGEVGRSSAEDGRLLSSAVSRRGGGVGAPVPSSASSPVQPLPRAPFFIMARPDR